MEKIAREQAEPRTDTLVWGKNAVTELLKSGGAVDTVYLADSLPQPVAGYYTALAKQTGAVVKRVPGHKLQKICGTDDHQGVAARAAEVQYATLEELFAAAEAKGEAPFLVLCDGVEDPHNLGAIIRSAYLCGAHGVVIPKRGGVGVTGTVMKSSAGAAARLPVARVSNLAQAAYWPTSGRNTFTVNPCPPMCWQREAGNVRADAVLTTAATTLFPTVLSSQWQTASVP